MKTTVGRSPLPPPTPGSGTRPLTRRELSVLPPSIPAGTRVGIHPIPHLRFWLSPGQHNHRPTRRYAESLPLPPHLVPGQLYFVSPDCRPTALHRRPRLPVLGLRGVDELQVADLLRRLWASPETTTKKKPCPS